MSPQQLPLELILQITEYLDLDERVRLFRIEKNTGSAIKRCLNNDKRHNSIKEIWN